MSQRASELPRAITINRTCHRVSYAASVMVLFGLLFRLPHSSLYHEDTGYDSGEVGGLTLMALLAVLSYYLLQGSNPGYISAEHIAEVAGLVGGGAEDGDEVVVSFVDGSETKRGPAAAGADGEVKGAPGEAVAPTTSEPLRKLCEDCKFVQPLRAKHCYTCDRCVSSYDHHCHMINTCIGEANHCRFWWFIALHMILLALASNVATSSIVYRRNYSDWFSDNALGFFVCLIVWCLLVPVFCLFCFHTWLACTNSTGYEVLKGSEHLRYLRGFGECDIPYSRGLLRNLRDFCCMRDMCLFVLFRQAWRPVPWRAPEKFDRHSDDVVNNIWENKYWSCC